MGDRSSDTVPLEPLFGEQLTAVHFVMDYLQLQFSNDSMLTALTWPSVHVGGTVLRYGMPNYRDALCERINKTVCAGKVVEADILRVEFDDNSVISISLRPEDRSGAEAVVLDHSPDHWSVW